MRFVEVSRVRLAGAVVAGALAIAACGGSDDAAAPEAVVSAEAADSGSVDAPDSVEAEGLLQTGTIEVEGPSLSPFTSTEGDETVGTASPVVSGVSFDGSAMAIGAPTDKPTMFVFLAHWCPHCNDEVPELIRMDDEGLLPDGVDLVGVSTAADPNGPNYPPSQWIDDKGWPWPVMIDDMNQSAIAAVGGTSFPFAVVLDADGTVLARRAGQATADDTVAFLDDALSRASA